MVNSFGSKIAILLMFVSFSSLVGEENFILINGNTNEIICEQGPHINNQMTPCSTFKITLSLMGYDAGILKDEKTPAWDFQEGYDSFIEDWKAPQTPQSWMTLSCVWYAKLLALQLGLEKVQAYLASFEYGNQDMSGGLAKPGPTKSAWINSSLKISPKEQVDFIQKMVMGKLSISSNATQMTKRLLFKEELSEGWELYGKTGLGSIVGEDGGNLKVRWFVGWIEKEQIFFPFAYQLLEVEIDVGQTIPRVKQLLVESKLINSMCTH